jgi:hypothetical protein
LRGDERRAGMDIDRGGAGRGAREEHAGGGRGRVEWSGVESGRARRTRRGNAWHSGVGPLVLRQRMG